MEQLYRILFSLHKEEISVPNSDADALLKATERLINKPQEDTTRRKCFKIAQENYNVKDYVK
jgi:hypothetical protein